MSSKRKSNKSDRIGCLPLNKRQCTKSHPKEYENIRETPKIGETTKPQQMKQIRFPVPKSLELHNRYPIMGQNIQLERSGRTLLINSDFQFSLGKKSRLSAKMDQVRQLYWNISANKEKESFSLRSKLSSISAKGLSNDI